MRFPILGLTGLTSGGGSGLLLLLSGMGRTASDIVREVLGEYLRISEEGEMTIFIGVVALIFSGLVALYTYNVGRYTKEVARCTGEYTMETRRLWEVTKKSYFVGAAAGYLFEKYYDHIKEWPSVGGDWGTWFKWPPKEEQRPQIFKSDCHRVILEELFPDIREIEEKAVNKLGKKGYKFT